MMKLLQNRDKPALQPCGELQRRLSVCLAPYTDSRFICSDELRGRWIQ
jgi:hypothetical protein